MVALQRALGGEEQGVLCNPVLSNCSPRGVEPPAFSMNFP